jgi:hypothetical protein
MKLATGRMTLAAGWCSSMRVMGGPVLAFVSGLKGNGGAK